MTAPQIVKHRGARTRQGDYYGPFASALAVNRTLNALERAFLLRSCSDSVYESRTRPCLLYQIKRCSAPVHRRDLARPITPSSCARRGISSPARAAPCSEQLAREMEKASERARFRARGAAARPHLGALGGAGAPGHQSAQRRGSRRLRRAPAGRRILRPGVLLPRRAELGQPRLLPARRRELEPGEVLDAFLAQFYDDKPPPRCVFLLARDRGPRAARGGADACGGRSVEVLAAAARREEGPRRPRARQRARGARPQARRRRSRSRTCSRRWRDVRSAGSAAAHRGLRQFPHPGRATRSAR